MIETTPEQIAKHFSACMDSVNLINELEAKTALTEEEVLKLKANKDHLDIMLGKDFFGGYDMQPLISAAKKKVVW